MTNPHFPTLNEAGTIEFAMSTLSQVEQWGTISVPKEAGNVEIRADWSKPRRKWRWNGTAHYQRDFDKVMGFLRARKGGGNFFYIDQNVIPIWSPSTDANDVATTSQTVSGAMDAHTVYVTFAWGDGTNKTEDSGEATQVVNANSLLTVTIPNFPAGVTQAEIYYGTVAGTMYWVGTETSSAGTYTEPFSTVDVNSASGQKVLSIAATTNFEAGQSILIGKGTARSETKIIDTVQAGVSITMTVNLAYTHTAVQADEAHISPDTGTSPATSNGLTGYEVKVRLLNDPAPRHIGGSVWSLVLDMEEMF